MLGRGFRGIAFRGKGIVKGSFCGEALVTREPISFLGGVDPSTGAVVERGHELMGKILARRALILPHGKGSTVGSYVLYSLAKRGLAPKAIVTVKADLMILTGCAISGIPLLSEVPREVLDVVKCGDVVEIDAYRGILRVFSKQE
jgi:predicted aconitase with swiveling domain